MKKINKLKLILFGIFTSIFFFQYMWFLYERIVIESKPWYHYSVILMSLITIVTAIVVVYLLHGFKNHKKCLQEVEKINFLSYRTADFGSAVNRFFSLLKRFKDPDLKRYIASKFGNHLPKETFSEFLQEVQKRTGKVRDLLPIFQKIYYDRFSEDVNHIFDGVAGEDSEINENVLDAMMVRIRKFHTLYGDENFNTFMPSLIIQFIVAHTFDNKDGVLKIIKELRAKPKCGPIGNRLISRDVYLAMLEEMFKQCQVRIMSKKFVPEKN